jgi:hypothetical protein
MAAWDRLDGESAKAHAAFVVYRDLGVQRSLQKAWERYTNGNTKAMPGYFGRWSSENAWVERAEAWDIEQQAIADEAATAVFDEMIREGRKEVIRRGVEDYRRLLEHFDEAIGQISAVRRSDGGYVTDPKTGERIKVVTVKIDLMNEWRLARWRKEIEMLGRLAFGLPATVKSADDSDTEADEVAALLDESDSGNGQADYL